MQLTKDNLWSGFDKIFSKTVGAVLKILNHPESQKRCDYGHMFIKNFSLKIITILGDDLVRQTKPLQSKKKIGSNANIQVFFKNFLKFFS